MTKYLNKFVKNKENEKWIAPALISLNYVISTEQILYQKLWTFMNFHLHEMSVSYIHKGKMNSRKLQQQFKARYITQFGREIFNDINAISFFLEFKSRKRL